MVEEIQEVEEQVHTWACSAGHFSNGCFCSRQPPPPPQPRLKATPKQVTKVVADIMNSKYDQMVLFRCRACSKQHIWNGVMQLRCPNCKK